MTRNDYPKINLFKKGSGEYICSTTWSKTCGEAVDRYVSKYPSLSNAVYGRFIKIRIDT